MPSYTILSFPLLKSVFATVEVAFPLLWAQLFLRHILDDKARYDNPVVAAYSLEEAKYLVAVAFPV